MMYLEVTQQFAVSTDRDCVAPLLQEPSSKMRRLGIYRLTGSVSRRDLTYVFGVVPLSKLNPLHEIPLACA
jgi:hypothetical protein